MYITVMLIALGVISVLDLDEVGSEPLIKELKLDAELAERLVAAAGEGIKRQAPETRQKQAEDLMEQEKEKTGSE